MRVSSMRRRYWREEVERREFDWVCIYNGTQAEDRGGGQAAHNLCSSTQEEKEQGRGGGGGDYCCGDYTRAEKEKDIGAACRRCTRVRRRDARRVRAEAAHRLGRRAIPRRRHGLADARRRVGPGGDHRRARAASRPAHVRRRSDRRRRRRRFVAVVEYAVTLPPGVRSCAEAVPRPARARVRRRRRRVGLHAATGAAVVSAGVPDAPRRRAAQAGSLRPPRRCPASARGPRAALRGAAAPRR